nr:hypothetical protein [Candidatus Njordarchaeota archaeon]
MWNWKKKFTVNEFTSVFPSPDPNKVLHDMTKKGFLQNIGWGRYRVSSPTEYVSKRISVSEAYGLLKQTRMKYALTGPDAVFMWTKGGYQVDRFLGFYPIHLKVRRANLGKWRYFLRSRRQRFHVKDRPVKQTLFGTFYILYPEVDFRVDDVEGFMVDPLVTAVEFCRSRSYSYEPALEMLDELYNIGLDVKYKEARTNL